MDISDWRQRPAFNNDFESGSEQNGNDWSAPSDSGAKSNG